MNQRRSQKRNWQMLIAEGKQNYNILKLKDSAKQGRGWQWKVLVTCILTDKTRKSSNKQPNLTTWRSKKRTATSIQT